MKKSASLKLTRCLSTVVSLVPLALAVPHAVANSLVPPDVGSAIAATAAEVQDPSRAPGLQGGKLSPVQAPAQPLGLKLAGPVMMGASDDASQVFQERVLPGMNSLLNIRLGERAAIRDAGMQLDPSKLSLKTASDVRVYFIGEGAGYHNTLGYNTTGGGVTSGNPLLIFPDASSSVSTVGGAKTAERTASLPLLPGDFVNLGPQAAGTELNFFLVADGANGGKDTFSTDKSANPDGINHVVAFSYAIPGSSYLIIGFEDLYGGGDRDFNDLLFAVDIGASNIAELTGTPEPALLATLLPLAGAVAWLKRRRQQQVPPGVPVPA